MSESSDEKRSPSSLLGLLLWRYEIPILTILIGFMAWVRTRSYERFVTDQGVRFRGNDAWYHLRETTYAVENWPATMPFDPWTRFPYGTTAGQFGTLFDQLVATAALVIGLGDPSPELIAKTLLVAPVVFGALTAIPAYLIGKRLGGRVGGLFGALVLALLPGTFLQYTLVGFSDHHAAEVLFQAVAVVAVMVALAVSEREKPVYELVVDRDVETLRAPVGWAAVAGVGVALYVWTWPPGVMLIAIVGVFAVLKMTASYLNGTSPEPVAFAAATSMAVAGVLLLSSLSEITFSPTSFGLLQPLLAFAVAATCLGLAWLARGWDRWDLDRRAYPATVFGVSVVGLALIAVLLPDLFGLLKGNFQRFVGFSAGAQTRTIGEAKPFLSQVSPGIGLDSRGVILREYGAMFYTAMLALGVLIARPLLRSGERRDVATLAGGVVALGIVWQFGVGGLLAGWLPFDVAPVIYETLTVGGIVAAMLLAGDHDGEEMFVVVWALFIVAAAFTQVRFNYYLAVVVAVLNAYLIGQLMVLLKIVEPDGTLRTEIEPYQVMALMLALLIVIPGLVHPIQIGQQGQQVYDTNTALEVGNSSAPGDVTNWDGTLTWMANNTPAEGTWAGADNSMGRYGTHDVPPDGDFEYEEGTYGVMSWWDYGHWITVRGERIPNANPFQEGATEAANFLLAPNETAAERIRQQLGEDDAETRYVVVDWKMVNVDSRQAKFTAPIVFYDDQNVSREDFVGDRIYQQSPRRGLFPVTRPKEQRYYESLMVRLYEYHGSAVEPQPVVLDWEVRQFQNNDGETVEVKVAPQNRDLVQRFQTMEQARAYVRNHSNAQIGGYGLVPQERVPALEHYRLVKVSESRALQSRGYQNSIVRQLRGMGENVSQRDFIRQPQWVKVFEKVDGATVRGQGPPNTTVTARVTMRMTTTNETFVYRQQTRTDEDGNFNMTLPYSTVGYENWGPEQGYTNVSVRADGPYTFSTPTQSNETEIWDHRDTANVTEAQVLGESEEFVEVELNRTTLLEFPDPNETDTGNETDVGNETDGNETDTGNATVVDDDGDARVVDSVGPATAGGDRKAKESEPGLPGDSGPRAGLVALVAAGIVLDVRRD